MLRFADFELDRGAYQLRRDGQLVHLERIPLELSFLLTERRGQLVTREEIVERIWEGVFLESDASINAAVRKIRQALGDDAEVPRFVVTIPTKGYRFIADVCEEALAASNPRHALRIDSLAVMPLDNLSGDRAQDYFSDGMTEELIAAVSRIEQLRVVSRTSVMQYKGARKSLSEIARELRVDAVVEGSVMRSGERV
jgi:DNA-binding winged helix-turn-helix (wHTH) protein